MKAVVRIGNKTYNVPRKQGSPFRETHQNGIEIAQLQHTPITGVLKATLNDKECGILYKTESTPPSKGAGIVVNTHTGEVWKPTEMDLVIVYESHDFKSFFENPPWSQNPNT